MAAWLVPLLLFLIPSVVSHEREFSEEGKLKILSVSTENISAVYREDGSRGVCISSTTSGKVDHTSLDGKEILFVRHSQLASASLLRIMGHSIFNKTPTQDSGHTLIDYALPSEISQHFDTALSLHHIPMELVHHLDADSIDDSFCEAL